MLYNQVRELESYRNAAKRSMIAFGMVAVLYSSSHEFLKEIATEKVSPIVYLPLMVAGGCLAVLASLRVAYLYKRAGNIRRQIGAQFGKSVKDIKASINPGDYFAFQEINAIFTMLRQSLKVR